MLLEMKERYIMMNFQEPQDFFLENGFRNFNNNSQCGTNSGVNKERPNPRRLHPKRGA